MSSREEIQKKMQTLVEKWQGKEVLRDSKAYLERTVDRIRYRNLRDELKALDNPTKTSDKMSLEELQEIFTEKKD